MARVITTAVALIFSLMLVSDLAHADGAATFAAKCKMCHGEAGKGGPIAKTPLSCGAKSDAELTKVIREGNVAIKMPAFGADKVSDADLPALVTYVKTLK